ncbi:sterol desaturase family protein [Flavobacteriaceae bacterium]|jgi:sterol desaturase/sphingolipid hydroxylase (fatty acid hydroxylase superfamily)|nr:sterol desaturase family protein [Flavobacteriaceae bacterium]MDB3865891.1 sterol desaturase family protein [bacterium]MDB4590159.1 sterol desaturase family protein [Flavobacteriaceae bacterium]MDC6467555.1 sterol desaturase family protein [Flavobacteriaceae bacterium]
MEKYVTAFINEFTSTLNWTLDSILFKVPWYNNYFWGLIVISLVVWLLEIIFPWRKNQSSIRKDFWMDGFYMFFNFFIFSILISGDYKALGLLFNEIGITTKSLAVFNISNWPIGFQLVVFFVILDFVQWLTHVLLHKYEVLWRFHKVHHSVKEMGFAAHLRYHWMENILYKPLKTLGVMVLGGFEPEQAYIVHFIAITIGHLNHANIRITWGPFKYILNNSVMHLYHHMKALPENKPKGINFGISLSIWDFLFRTHYIPDDNGEIELGFSNEENFPKGFFGHLFTGFGKN